MNLDKLKETARRHELREEWRRAIDTYHRAAGALSEAGAPVDPALYNRIGDLELKVGSSGDALAAYRRAVDLYAEQGFFNNAIALCGKILRVDPGETPTYLRLAELHARKNVIPEARRNLVEYVERMHMARQIGPATETLKSFAVRFAASPELIQVVGELLKALGGADDVEATLQSLLHDADVAPEPGRKGERHRSERGTAPVQGLVFIDTGIDIPGVAGLTRGSGLEVVPELDPGFEEGSSEEPEPEPVLGFEPTALDQVPVEVDEMFPLVEPSDYESLEVPGLEPATEFFGTPADFGSEPLEPLFLEPPELAPLSLEDEPAEDSSLGGAQREVAVGGEDLFDTLDVEDERGPPRSAPRVRSIEELERMLAVREAAEDWAAALRVSSDLLLAEPDNLARYQKRVELAYRAGDPQLLVSTYLSLGGVLRRRGIVNNALMVYHRVLEHDPGNPVALAAMAALRPVEAPAAESAEPDPEPSEPGDFVDLGALILEPEPERDTRMRVEPTEPVGDEDKDFLDTLTQFKEGIEANLDVSDFQAHYDLGIAFKEMGLLDEAIAQFQKALRAPEGRLRSSEALGVAFFEKGRYTIAETVLSRAVEALPGADDEKIALLYWLGRTHEAQGRATEAVRWYERAMAVDIRFLDLGERVQRLGSGGQS